MLILDTNVISELVKIKPSKDVIKWSYAQNRLDFSTTSICKAEILYGLAIAPIGKAKASLAVALAEIFEGALGNRVLPFDSRAAETFARLRAHRRAMGRPLQEADGQIAAICALHSATLVTRDIADFGHLGLTLVNPWTD